jgi:hypothetical protein
MTQRQLSLCLSAAIAIAMYSCKKAGSTVVEPPEPPIGTNLIGNYSFEVNKTPSLQGWVTTDTSAIGFSSDTPPNGGTWSIYIETTMQPGAEVQTAIAMPQGTYRYRLSTWAKRNNFGGGVFLIFNKAIRKFLPIEDTTWTLCTINDTLTTVVGDTVIVALTGGGSELIAGRTYFDICKFERLD